MTDAYLNEDHPFFSEDNMHELAGLIEARVLRLTHDQIHFALTKETTDQMVQAAMDYRECLVTVDPHEGVGKLNEVVVRRAVRALTQETVEGQHDAQNVFHQNTRSTRRDENDPDSLEDPKQAFTVFSSGNPYKSHVDRWREEDRARQAAYMHDPREHLWAGAELRSEPQFLQ